MRPVMCRNRLSGGSANCARASSMTIGLRVRARKSSSPVCITPKRNATSLFPFMARLGNGRRSTRWNPGPKSSQPRSLFPARGRVHTCSLQQGYCALKKGEVLERSTRKSKRAYGEAEEPPRHGVCHRLRKHGELWRGLARNRYEGKSSRHHPWPDTRRARCIPCCGNGENAVAGFIQRHGARCWPGGKRLPDRVGVG